jgi:hypothetical protein
MNMAEVENIIPALIELIKQESQRRNTLLMDEVDMVTELRLTSKRSLDKLPDDFPKPVLTHPKRWSREAVEKWVGMERRHVKAAAGRPRKRA